MDETTRYLELEIEEVVIKGDGGGGGGGDTPCADAIALIEGTIESIDYEDVTTVRPYAFACCSNLKTVNLPNATSLGETAFGASGITNPSFPKVTTIGQYCFEECKNIKTVDFPNATTLESKVFTKSGITNPTFPKVTTIGDKCFSECENIKTITQDNFPALTIINAHAFDNIPNLTLVDFSNVTSIERQAFKNCPSLKTVILRNDVLITSESQVFDICEALESIYVPDALVDSYKTAENWSVYADLIKPLSEYAG